MSLFQLSVNVRDVEESVVFYEKLLGVGPAKHRRWAGRFLPGADDHFHPDDAGSDALCAALALFATLEAAAFVVTASSQLRA